jgi:hypothetical protein
MKKKKSSVLVGMTAYIRNQEEQEKRAEQLALGNFAPRR